MSGYTPSQLDGDQSAKAMDAGANAGIPHTDLSDGLHEHAQAKGHPTGEKTAGAGVSAFHTDGAVGKQFTTDGVIGGTAQKIGGPFDQSGSIGKHFTTSGSVGASVQEHLGHNETNTFQKQ